jgi:hypothetical protein
MEAAEWDRSLNEWASFHRAEHKLDHFAISSEMIQFDHPGEPSEMGINDPLNYAKWESI